MFVTLPHPLPLRFQKKNAASRRARSVCVTTHTSAEKSVYFPSTALEVHFSQVLRCTVQASVQVCKVACTPSLFFCCTQVKKCSSPKRGARVHRGSISVRLDASKPTTLSNNAVLPLRESRKSPKPLRTSVKSRHGQRSQEETPPQELRPLRVLRPHQRFTPLNV